MVGAFRVERLIAAGSIGAVYEATQLSLGRTVALRLIGADHFSGPDEVARFDEAQRLTASLHHPNLVACYEAGEWEGGRFVAMRYIRGKRLADLLEQGSPVSVESLEPLAEALEAAHEVGLVHGRVRAETIFVEADGTPYLADLGLGRSGSSQADAQALGNVIAQLPSQAALERTRSASRPLRLGLAAFAAAAAIVLVLVFNRDDTSGALEDPPPAPAGTTSLGSPLPAVVTQPFGCQAQPSPNTPACTVAQAALGGGDLTVPRPGVVRSWAIRGAAGDLSLQVIRERGGESFAAGFSQPQNLTDAAPHAFPAEIAVRPGDRIGLRLGPGAVVGARTSASDSTVLRWDGGLTGDSQVADATVVDTELMLRADVEFGASPEGPRQLVGRQAASAPAGRPLGDTSVAQGARAVVVELPGAIAIDVFRGRRLARLEVPDADPDGEFLELSQNCGPPGQGGFCLRWRNPGEALPLFHEYKVRGDGRIELIG